MITIQEFKRNVESGKWKENTQALRILLFISISLSSFLLPLSTLSQTLTGSAPSHVAVGEQFRLTYTINTQNVSDFRAGDIPDELEVLIA